MPASLVLELGLSFTTIHLPSTPIPFDINLLVSCATWTSKAHLQAVLAGSAFDNTGINICCDGAPHPIACGHRPHKLDSHIRLLCPVWQRFHSIYLAQSIPSRALAWIQASLSRKHRRGERSSSAAHAEPR